MPAIGFGFGGVIAGFSGDLMFLGFLLMGLIGSATYGYSEGYKAAKSLIKTALFGGIGFFLGFNIPLFVMLTLWEPPMKFLLTGLFGGGLGGIMIGLSIKNPATAVKLGISGAIGFGLGMSLFEFTKLPHIFALTGLLGGAALGFGSRTLQQD